MSSFELYKQPVVYKIGTLKSPYNYYVIASLILTIISIILLFYFYILKLKYDHFMFGWLISPIVVSIIFISSPESSFVVMVQSGFINIFGIFHIISILICLYANLLANKTSNNNRRNKILNTNT